MKIHTPNPEEFTLIYTHPLSNTPRTPLLSYLFTTKFSQSNKIDAIGKIQYQSCLKIRNQLYIGGVEYLILYVFT